MYFSIKSFATEGVGTKNVQGIHDGSSVLRKAKDLMPRDIMSSEPRHWMLFGQLVMPVQYCAEAWICRDLEIWEPGNLES